MRFNHDIQTIKGEESVMAELLIFVQALEHEYSELGSVGFDMTDMIFTPRASVAITTNIYLSTMLGIPTPDYILNRQLESMFNERVAVD